MIKTSEKAIDFELYDLDKNLHKLGDYEGKITVLNFWSAECPWSARADEALLQHEKEWGDAVQLLWIAPNANEPVEMLKETAGARGIGTVLVDEDRTVTEQYGATATPHVFVLDAGGVVRYLGAFDNATFRRREPTKFYLKEAVNALLAGDNPEPAETEAYGCTIVHYEAQH